MSKRVVYGNFLNKHVIEPPPGYVEFAVEIIREYSANEFVGKLYRKLSTGDWVPVDGGRLVGYSWYKQFQEKRKLQFEMQGSGPWRVLHFRLESDETGPYVAVALQYAHQPVAVGQ
ncbi:MAG TPA: hypothetical protein VGZ29_08860 [Terriglobia bacterium]|nr:hypothetical protein [Terriglobia bacterium]